MISTGFTFDDITSQSMGVQIVRLDNSLPSRPFTSAKEILEEHPNNSLMPNFLGVKYTPITFNITISSIDGGNMDINKMYELGSWLFKDEYKTFVSDDNPSKLFYVIFTNQVDFYTNGLDDGYFELQGRCRDGFAWTTPIIDEYDLSSNTTSTPITITNLSNVRDYFYPIVEVELVDTATGFSIVNNSDGGNTFTFTGLDLLETVYIDNEKRLIISNTGENRFSDFNKNWLRFKTGNNNLTVSGKCIVRIKSHYPIFN